jgi:hypothetical protein
MLALVLWNNGSPAHGRRMRGELSESFDHLVQAAGHAAGGMAETATPRYDRALDRLHPLLEYVRQGAAEARARRSRRRARWLLVAVSLAAAGAAGIAGLLAARRSGPARLGGGEPADLDRVAAAATDPAIALEDPTTYQAPSRLTAAAQRVTEGTARVADTVAVGADKLAHALHDRASTDGRHRSPA